MLKIIILLNFGVFIFGNLFFKLKLKKIGIDPIGIPAINKKIFIFGKLSMFLCWFFLIGQVLGIPFYKSNLPSYMSWLSTFFLIIGNAFIIVSLFYLGHSGRMGLPKENTSLKISGIYRISRNPMYVGFTMMCIASCIYVPHIINLAFGLSAFIVHHRIILAEEEFLNSRFNKDWLAYKNEVRRYL